MSNEPWQEDHFTKVAGLLGLPACLDLLRKQFRLSDIQVKFYAYPSKPAKETPKQEIEIGDTIRFIRNTTNHACNSNGSRCATGDLGVVRKISDDPHYRYYFSTPSVDGTTSRDWYCANESDVVLHAKARKARKGRTPEKGEVKVGDKLVFIRNTTNNCRFGESSVDFPPYAKTGDEFVVQMIRDESGDELYELPNSYVASRLDVAFAE